MTAYDNATESIEDWAVRTAPSLDANEWASVNRSGQEGRGYPVGRFTEDGVRGLLARRDKVAAELTTRQRAGLQRLTDGLGSHVWGAAEQALVPVALATLEGCRLTDFGREIVRHLATILPAGTDVIVRDTLDLVEQVEQVEQVLPLLRDTIMDPAPRMVEVRRSEPGRSAVLPFVGLPERKCFSASISCTWALLGSIAAEAGLVEIDGWDTRSLMYGPRDAWQRFYKAVYKARTEEQGPWKARLTRCLDRVHHCAWGRGGKVCA